MTTTTDNNDTCDVCHTPTPRAALTSVANTFNPNKACIDCISRFIETGHWYEYTLTTARDTDGMLHRIEDTAPESPIILTSCGEELTSTPERHPDPNNVGYSNEHQCPNCNWTSTSMYGSQA